MESLRGRIGLVTGGGSGFGRAIALEMARQGADVVVNDIDAAAAEAIAQAVRSEGRRALALVADVADTGTVEAMVDQAQAMLGQVDLLVNNAGHGDAGEIPIEEMDDGRWDRMLDVHLGGTMRVTRAVVPGMKEKGRGRIVNISSTSGLVGEPDYAHYCTAKAGIVGFTRAMARELIPWRINVNAVAPGVCATGWFDQADPARVERVREMISWGRMGTAEEIAALVVFLLSDRADFITGQVISPNGGMVIGGV